MWDEGLLDEHRRSMASMESGTAYKRRAGMVSEWQPLPNVICSLSLR
jgi:hypothetical protein